ncbi:junctional adhesion molecule B-like isoform X2 [Eriocheir sinensis]|uniref:junctional adhesion molecule B-like isoform X2 n=1 Tax=Eriocheir sinensis TaxID=95602 RepID=UPI0021C90654|nr:junctional adhesion molecule B-like isoform X2 [Eriocheir sinensis]
MGASRQPFVCLLLAVAALLAEVAGDGGGQLEVEMAGGGGGGGGVGGGGGPGGVMADQLLNNSHTVVLPGDSAKLACPLSSDVYGSRVSWIRRRDMQLLSIGDNLFTGDHRIFVSHSRHQHKKDSRHTQVWFLHLKNVTKDDEGEYECQTSTHPPSSYMTFLKVQTAWSELQGTAVRHVAAGSTLRLVCTFRDAQLPLKYVFWYQDSKMINFDKERGVNFTLERDHSVLTVSSVSDSHAGNYTCQPANTAPSSVLVLVMVETTEPGAEGSRGQKGAENEKTQVRQLGVKSASSAGPRLLPRTLALFLLGPLLLDALAFPRVFHSNL